MVDKKYCLKKAVEITKEHARGGSATLPSTVLKSVYEELLKLTKDAETTEE